MRISEVAQQTGLSVSTLRYYEASGLCPPIARGTDGMRVFSKTDVDWLMLMASLRATGMPMTQMRAFAQLYALGDDTAAQRKAALLSHRDRLEDRQAQLDLCRALLDHKLQKYSEILKDKTCGSS